MGIDLMRGSKFRKHELRQELCNVRWTKGNSVRLFSILEQAGYIKVNGKFVVIRRNLTLR